MEKTTWKNWRVGRRIIQDAAEKRAIMKTINWNTCCFIIAPIYCIEVNTVFQLIIVFIIARFSAALF
jgi:hypothetical protein